ncbi:hypothetical protein LguiA_004311 [Lonicera macranthoides]
MEKCLQVSSVSSSARGLALHSKNQYQFCSKEKVHFQACKSMKSSSNNGVSFSSSSARSLNPKRALTTPRIVCKASVAEVKVVTESSWDELVLKSKTLVLVDFWAPWCGPCRMIAPVIDELAKEYTGKLTCYKLNTDDSPGIASQFGIRSIPTVLFFKSGEKKESVIGAVPKSTLTATIEKYLEG